MMIYFMSMEIIVLLRRNGIVDIWKVWVKDEFSHVFEDSILG